MEMPIIHLQTTTPGKVLDSLAPLDKSEHKPPQSRNPELCYETSLVSSVYWLRRRQRLIWHVISCQALGNDKQRAYTRYTVMTQGLAHCTCSYHWYETFRLNMVLSEIYFPQKLNVNARNLLILFGESKH